MRNLMLATLLLCDTTVWAQSDKDFKPKYLIKAYANGNITPYADITTKSNTTFNAKASSYIQPSAAISVYNKKGNYHELELSSIRSTKTEMIEYFEDAQGMTLPVSGYILNNTRIAMRYEYVHVFMKENKSRLKPALGLGAMPYYNRNNFTPLITSNYPYKKTSMGVQAYVIPRLAIRLSERIDLDLNVPVCIADVAKTKSLTLNPTLPSDMQHTSSADFSLLPRNYTVRLGLVVKL